MPSTFCVIGRNFIFYCCPTPSDHLGRCTEFHIVAQLVELFCSHSSPPKWCSHWRGILPRFLCRPSFWPEHLDRKGSELSRHEWIRGNFVQSSTSDVASASCYFYVRLYDLLPQACTNQVALTLPISEERQRSELPNDRYCPTLPWTIMLISCQIFFHS
jgi:hypothetical protein